MDCACPRLDSAHTDCAAGNVGRRGGSGGAGSCSPDIREDILLGGVPAGGGTGCCRTASAHGSPLHSAPLALRRAAHSAAPGPAGTLRDGRIMRNAGGGVAPRSLQHLRALRLAMAPACRAVGRRLRGGRRLGAGRRRVAGGDGGCARHSLARRAHGVQYGVPRRHLPGAFLPIFPAALRHRHRSVCELPQMRARLQRALHRP